MIPSAQIENCKRGDNIYIRGRKYKFYEFRPLAPSHPLLAQDSRGAIYHFSLNMVSQIERIVPLERQRKKTQRRNYTFVASDAGRTEGEHKDCTVRALSIAAMVDYETAKQFMKDHGRKDGKGCTTMVYLRWDINNYRITVFPNPEGKYNHKTVGQWLKSGQLPKRCMLNISGHVFAVVNNVVYDTFKVGSRTKVWEVYEVKENV